MTTSLIRLNSTWGKFINAAATLGLVLLLLAGHGLLAQTADTTLARQYNEKAAELRRNGAFDSAYYYWRQAADIYESRQLWQDYIFVQYSIGQARNVKAEYDEAKSILLSALDLGIEKLTEQNSAVAYICYSLSWHYGALAKYDSAMFYQNKAIAIRKGLFGDVHSELARSYGNQGFNYRMMGKYDSAMIFYREALRIREELHGKDHEDVASTLFSIAWIRSAKGDYRQALELHHRALEIRKARLSPGSNNIASSINNIGWCYVQLGDYERALENYEEALQMRIDRFGPDHPSIASSLHNMGVLYSQKHDFDKAISYHLRANDIFTATYGDKHEDLAQYYNFLGTAYFGKRDYENALRYHLLAKSVADNIEGDHLYKSQTYLHLGKVYGELSNFDKQGEYYHKALPIEIELNGATHRNVARIYVNLASYYGHKGERTIQLQNLEKALDIRRQVFGDSHHLVAQTHLALGDYYQDINELDIAMANYDQALQVLSGSNNDKNEAISLQISKLPALQKKALLLMKTGKAGNDINLQKQALQSFSSAIQILDTIRYSHLSAESKSDLSSRSLGLFQGAIELAYDLYQQTADERYLEGAFSFMEGSKSFLLNVALKDAEARRYAGMPDSLLVKERQLRIDIAFLESKLMEVNVDDNARRESLLAQLFDHQRQYQGFVATLEKQYPKYFQLKYASQKLSIANIRTGLLNTESALVEYFHGDDAIYVLGISKKGQSFERIDNVEEVEQLIGDFRRSISDYQFLTNQSLEADELYARSANQLYELLLYKTLTAFDDQVTQLIIVPDGEINHVNMEPLLGTLPATGENLKYKDLDYLVSRYQFSYSHSANTLYQTSNSSIGGVDGSFAGFAPQYAASSYSDADSAEHLMAQLLVRDGNLPLPGASIEVQKIGELFGGEVMLREQASERNFKAVARKYQILHLAMHGLLDDENPLRSELLFTDLPDSVEDGFLTVGEIYNLDLQAEMVVLSACNSGYGKLQRGEGNISLSRAFRYAGSNSIVMSLWKIPDNATAEIMIRFYENLLDGQSKDEALRKAKIDFLQTSEDPLLSHPFFWAGFIPIGEMAPISKNNNWWWWTILAIAVMGIGLRAATRARAKA